jgi:hypothetical protein
MGRILVHARMFLKHHTPVLSRTLEKTFKFKHSREQEVGTNRIASPDLSAIRLVSELLYLNVKETRDFR